MASSFSTMVNWAVWAMNCELSTGSMGFWYLSWATSSLRNMSLPDTWGSVWPVAPASGAETGDGSAAEAIRPVTKVIASMLTGAPFFRSQEQVEPSVAPPVQRDDSRHDLVRHLRRGRGRGRFGRGGDRLGRTGRRRARGGQGGGLGSDDAFRRPPRWSNGASGGSGWLRGAAVLL